MELTRSKITVDRLTLRQKEGFLSAMPFGCNRFGSQFERVLPASAIGNMFPFNFSGKTDPKGFYIGRDKYGTNILVDLDRRADDKTNSNILILGNSGQGKSYLMKLLLTNLREAGKRVLVLDAEGEYGELAENNGGCCLDLLDGQYMINILEPKVWASEPVEDPDAPEAFRKSGRIGQHIAFLKDWFRSYKDFTDAEVDTIEIMLSQLYREFGLTEKTDFSKLKPENYPILSDLYKLCLQEYYENRRQYMKPKEEWILVENTHEPLIDWETFDKVQGLAQRKNEEYFENLGRFTHLKTTENILKGLVYCADCKRPLVRYKNVSHEKSCGIRSSAKRIPTTSQAAPRRISGRMC